MIPTHFRRTCARFLVLSWLVQVILTLAAIALVAAGWQAVTLAVLLIRSDPSQVWTVLGMVAAASVASLWAASVEKAASRARKLEQRVVALERWRDMATAAGVEQQDQLEALQVRVSRAELARADFEHGLIKDPREARR